MALDFKGAPVRTMSSLNTVPEEKNEIAAVEAYDISADREEMERTLTNSAEVDAIVSKIEVYNMETIVSFGAEAAEEISKASDVVLRSMNMSQLDDSSRMLKTLAGIMSKFDIDEIREDKGLFNRLFSNAKKQLDKILAKYKTMGDEVDKIYVELRKYEQEIKQSNKKLDDLFNANVGYYHELVKYIITGEQACNEMEAYIAQRQRAYETTVDN